MAILLACLMMFSAALAQTSDKPDLSLQSTLYRYRFMKEYLPLLMLKKDAKAVGNALQDSQRFLARVLRAGNLGGGHTSGEMRLG